MNFISKCVRHILNRILFGAKVNSKTYIKHLRRKGAKIGEGTRLFRPTTIQIDETDAYMVQIGRNCQITGETVRKPEMM